MAAENKNLGREVAGCNYVANDRIWKSHINQEETSAKLWPKDWGFLTTPYQELIGDEIKQIRDPNRPKAEVPAHMQIPPVTPIENYIKVGPSPKPIPGKTSQEIGWRSSKPDLALEKYGGYAKPKGSILKRLNWPAEAAI